MGDEAENELASWQGAFRTTGLGRGPTWVPMEAAQSRCPIACSSESPSPGQAAQTWQGGPPGLSKEAGAILQPHPSLPLSPVPWEGPWLNLRRGGGCWGSMPHPWDGCLAQGPFALQDIPL